MKAVEVSDPLVWDRALLALPNPHILQSWRWGEVKARHGWHATRLLFEQDGRTVAATSVLERRLPYLPAGILYVAKGPALDWADAGLAGQVLAELERLTGRRRALFIKIDPDVYYKENERGDLPAAPPGAGDYKTAPEPGKYPAYCKETLMTRPACAPDVARLLAERGWRFSAEQIQFRNTLLLDLTRPEDELLSAMKQKTRYNVRLAERKGVVVRPGSGSDLDLFYRLYAETASRDGFVIRPPEYYRDAWGRFMEPGPDAASPAAHMLLAEVEGEIVAGLILFIFGPTAWYMYGASAERYREWMPNYLLQWEAIRLARSLGCTLYDLWGAPDTLDDTDPMWGVVRFKLGLGGTLASGLGAWDYARHRFPYWAYSSAMPRYLGWLRSLRPLPSPRRDRHRPRAIGRQSFDISLSSWYNGPVLQAGRIRLGA